MKKSDEEGVALIIQSYLKSSEKQQKESQLKIIRISQIYSKKAWQKRLIQQMYGIFKKLINKKDSIGLVCKRLLKIWDQILENQTNKNNSNAYRLAVSEIIVECYKFIFPLIIEYKFHDAILDFKVYRMMWAKCITDEAFYSLRTQISKIYRNFDLNKGFTSENIQKIKKRFAKREATEQQIQKYMGIAHVQRRQQPSASNQRKISNESSDEEEEEVIRKQIKQDFNQPYAEASYSPTPDRFDYLSTYPQNYQIQMPPNPYQSRPIMQQNLPQHQHYGNQNPSMNLYSTYSRPSFSNGYNLQNPQVQNFSMPIMQHSHHSQPYFPNPKVQTYNNGAIYPEYIQNINYKPNPNNYPNSIINPHIQNSGQNNFQPPLVQSNFNSVANPNMMRAHKIAPPPPPPNEYIPMSIKQMKRQSPEFTPKNTVSTPINSKYYSQIIDSASTAKTDFKIASPQIFTQRSERQKYKILLNNLKKGLNECKQCGVNFLCRDNLEEHKKQHLFEAQRRFLSKQSENLGNNLGIQKQKPKYLSNFDMLCNQHWVGGAFDRQGKDDYQVSIKRLPQIDRIPIFHCYFCNDEMEIVWCDILQQWTLNNGVRIHEQQNGLGVAHFDCYSCFRGQNTSFHQITYLCN